MSILKKGHQPGVYVPLMALFLVMMGKRITNFLICFPMDYRDFSVKSKVIIHCFKQWNYDFRFSLFVNSFYRR